MKHKDNLETLLASSIFSTDRPYTFDAVITEVSEKATKFNDKYLIFTLNHGLTKVEGRKWNSTLADKEVFKQGQIAQLTGRFSEYKGKFQFSVDQALLVTDQSKYQQLLPVAPNHSQLCQQLMSFFEQIEDPDYAKIIETVFDAETLKKFQTTRAALKNHHNVYGGLLWHTVTMLQLVENVVKTYDYLAIDRSLLYAGVIFHDFGKIAEIGDFFQNKYSLAGNLLGHIVIGSQVVELVGKKLQIDPHKVMLLQHLILASHGKLENASPVEPKTIEAVILSQIDNLDAKLGAIFIHKNETLQTDSSEQYLRLDEKPINFYFHDLKK